MVTADGMSGYQNDLGKNHFSDYIGKPINENQLWNVLSKYFKRREKEADEEVSTPVPVIPAPVKGEIYIPNEDEEYIFDTSDKEMLKDFIDSVQKEDEAIERAWNKKDMITVKRIAHTIKGLSKYVNASLLTEVALRVEERTGTTLENTRTTQADIDRFIDILQEYLIAMEGHLES